MEDILKLVEKRNQLVFLILAKIYVRTKGRTNEGIWESEIKSDLQKLMGDEFDAEEFNTAVQYCISEQLINGFSYSLTTSGRRYFENLLISLQNAPTEDKKLLKENLPEKVSKYLEITEKIITIGSFLSRVIGQLPPA